MPPYKPIEIRFWSKVNIPPDRNRNDCWEWIGRVNAMGYGCFDLTARKPVLAHRLAYELHHATEIPNGLHVCHSCDNPKCVNPSHLWLGNDKDNADDRERKGRGVHVTGARNGKIKFTDAQIDQIFELRKQGLSHSQIGRIIGCHKGYVGHILSGKVRKRG